MVPHNFLEASVGIGHCAKVVFQWTFFIFFPSPSCYANNVYLVVFCQHLVLLFNSFHIVHNHFAPNLCSM